jgi:ATP-dependent Clp protease ATP-binding subunit ClpC
VTASPRLLGVERDRFDPALLRATGDLIEILAAAIELQAGQIRPSHVLVACAGIPDGVLARLLDRHGIPPETFQEAMATFREGGPAAEDMDEPSMSEAMRQVARSLATDAAAGELIDERRLVARALERLEPAVDDWLRRYGGLDPQELAHALLQPASSGGSGPDPLRPDGTLDPEALTPAARRMLAATMAAAGRGEKPPTPLQLLDAMAAPGGLLDQGLLFLHRDPSRLRRRLRSLLGEPVASPRAGPLPEARVEGEMAALLRRAAGHATDRSAEAVGEPDLLAGLLETRGLAARLLAETGVDTKRLRWFATRGYREPAEAPEPARALEPAEAMTMLRAAVVGQPMVVERLEPYVARFMHRQRLGFGRNARGPVATLLFCGPSGTGKTMTAHVLARVLYGSEEAVLAFDMGQFNARESINHFIGAPPGYVGYGDGQLTKGLRDDPHRVLLFDEVDKAHPLVFDALLHLLDEGEINDPGHGPRPARESVVVMTSNLDAARFAALAAAPADTPALRDESRAVLRGFFREEFLNRIDEVVPFRELDDAALRGIAELTLERLAAQAEGELDLTLRWDPEVAAVAAEQARTWHAGEAARGIERVVRDLEPAMLALVEATRSAGSPASRLRLTVDGGRITARQEGGHDD